MRSRVRRVITVGVIGLMFTSAQRVTAQDQRSAILNAERATAELSRSSGFAGAILGSIHRDGILLWPGAPVVAGTSDLRRLLAVLHADSLQLTWQPLGIELARDSSLGMTWGVAVASASGTAPKPEIGSYIAAWRRDGTRWTMAALVFAGLRRLPKPAVSGEIPVSRKAIEAGGTFDDRGLLTRGPKAIGRAVDFPAVWRWHPVAAGASGSGDLGWTVGEATIAGKDAAPTYSKYLTIWNRRSDGAVRFLTDGGNGRPVTLGP